MSPEPTTPPQAAASPPPKKKKGKLYLVLSAALCVATSVVVGFVAVPGASPGEEDPEHAAGKEGKRESFLVDIPDHFVNLLGGANRRILKLQVSLVVESSNPTASRDHFQKILPHVKDLLTVVFSSKQFEEIDTFEEKGALKVEVVAELNRSLPLLEGDEVVQILFPEFVVQ